jgi:hypothetical protein
VRRVRKSRTSGLRIENRSTIHNDLRHLPHFYGGCNVSECQPSNTYLEPRSTVQIVGESIPKSFPIYTKHSPDRGYTHVLIAAPNSRYSIATPTAAYYPTIMGQVSVLARQTLLSLQYRNALFHFAYPTPSTHTHYTRSAHSVRTYRYRAI